MTKTPLTERTPFGDQMLIAGIAPIIAHDQLILRAASSILRFFGGRVFDPENREPLFLNTLRRNPEAAQKPCDFGLFDLDARDQCDLIDFLRATATGAPTPDPQQED